MYIIIIVIIIIIIIIIIINYRIFKGAESYFMVSELLKSKSK